MAMGHYRMASHALKQVCFKKSSTSQVFRNLIAECVGYRRSRFYISCFVRCSVIDGSHSVEFDLRWTSCPWLFYVLRSCIPEAPDETEDSGIRLALKLSPLLWSGIPVVLFKNAYLETGATVGLCIKVFVQFSCLEELKQTYSANNGLRFVVSWKCGYERHKHQTDFAKHK